MSAPMKEISGCCSDRINVRNGERKDWEPEMPCEEYLRRWKNCKSYLGQFHHYYIYGTTQDCQPHKAFYDNCVLWERTQALDAKHKLEELQHEEHLKMTKYPPLWEPRTHPPENWNSPIQNSDKTDTNVVR